MNRLLILLFAASCLTAVGQVPNYVPTDGLISWYPFNGNAHDESGSDLHALPLAVDLIEDRFGIPGSAYHFSGEDSSFLVLPDMPSPQEFSLSVWCKKEVDSNLDSWIYGDWQGSAPVFGTGVQYQGGIGLVIRTDNLIYAHIDSDETSGSNNSETNGYSSSSSTIGIETWEHIVVTRSNGQTSFWVNSELSETVLDYSEHPTDREASARIGASAIDSQKFQGTIDDFGFWSRALDVSEIQGLFSVTSPQGGCTNVEACNFNEQAVFDDGTCLYTPQQSLESTIQLSDENNLAVAVPEGLQSWTWSDGDNDSLKLIQPNKEYVLNGVIGSVPSFGETMAGGVIFHIDTVNGKVLLASSEPIAYDIYWGCTDLETGAVATAIGDGITNTETILAACQQTNCAARVASEFGNGWFLPSRDELEAIRTRLFETGLVDYSSGNPLNWYWTSSECLTDFTDATDIQFATGFIHECNNKNSPGGGIIAVREEPSSFCFYSDTITVEVNETVLCDSVYNPDVDLDNFIGLQDILAILSYYNASWPPWQCGDPLEYQGYDYETVQIGEQCWFAENLRAESYRNGEAIPDDLSDSEWAGTVEGAASVYGGDLVNLSTYGRLYNWFAVVHEGELCPHDWSVPSDGEWMTMEISLGMSESVLNNTSWRGTNQGLQMKTVYGWADDGNGTNSSGFTGLPGGARDSSGFYYLEETYGLWWSSSAEGSSSWFRSLEFDQSGVGRASSDPHYGGYVRCIKDTE